MDKSLNLKSTKKLNKISLQKLNKNSRKSKYMM